MTFDIHDGAIQANPDRLKPVLQAWGSPFVVPPSGGPDSLRSVFGVREIPSPAERR